MFRDKLQTTKQTKEEINMYVLQKLAIKMAPRVIANPALLAPTLIIGGVALACEVLD